MSCVGNKLMMLPTTTNGGNRKCPPTYIQAFLYMYEQSYIHVRAGVLNTCIDTCNSMKYNSIDTCNSMKYNSMKLCSVRSIYVQTMVQLKWKCLPQRMDRSTCNSVSMHVLSLSVYDLCSGDHWLNNKTSVCRQCTAGCSLPVKVFVVMCEFNEGF